MTPSRKNIAVSAVLSVTAVLLTVFSAQLADDMRQAVMRCMNIIIPSLFAFMAVSDLMVRSGGYIPLSAPLRPLSWLAGLPKEYGALFLISNIAGYPVGASMICRMYDRKTLDKRDAERLLCTCYGAGPAFFCSAVGVTVFGSQRTGMLIFLSCAAANIIVSAVVFRIFPIRRTEQTVNRTFSAEMLPESVSAAGRGLFGICSMILFFQMIMTLVSPLTEHIPVTDNTRRTMLAFIEISSLTSLTGTPYRMLPLIAAAGAFGGVCVLMQVYVIVGGRFSLKPFLTARTAGTCVSAGMMRLLWHLFGTKTAAASTGLSIMVNFNNFIPSVCLIMMIFLTVLRKRVAFSD